jgi:hypothetical protein
MLNRVTIEMKMKWQENRVRETLIKKEAGKKNMDLGFSREFVSVVQQHRRGR